MIRKLSALRFNHPEPAQVRSNALAGIMKNGDEGADLSFDDSTGIVFITKPKSAKAVHLSNLAWIEFTPPEQPPGTTAVRGK